MITHKLREAIAVVTKALDDMSGGGPTIAHYVRELLDPQPEIKNEDKEV